VLIAAAVCNIQHFEPNPIISTPGHLSFHPDDDPSSPSMSFQPEMTPMHPRSLSASKTMQCKSVPWVNDPRLPPHTTTCCDPSPRPSPWLRPLLLPQIVTARSHASCLRPLRLVQALENGPKDSTDGPSRVIDPHLRDTTMTHRDPTPSNPPMVVCTQRPCHSLAYPPLLSQIANLDTPMCAPSFPPAPPAWRLMQIASPGGCIPPPSTFSRAIGPLSPFWATTYWLPLKMLQWSNKCMVKRYASPLRVYDPGGPMSQCIIFLWTITWSQYPNLWGQCSPSHHAFDSGGPANMGVTLSYPFSVLVALLTWASLYFLYPSMVPKTLLTQALRHLWTHGPWAISP